MTEELKPKVGDILVIEGDSDEEEYPIDEVGDAVPDLENTWMVKAGGDWFQAEWDEENTRWFAPKETENEEEEEE